MIPAAGDEAGLAIREVSPKQGKAGDTVLVMGSGIVKDAVVTVGGVMAEAQIAPDGTVAAVQVPAGSGIADIIVANPDGAARKMAGGFQYKI